MGVAIAISLISYIQAELYVIAYAVPVNGGHVNLTSESIRTSPTELLDPENVGVAVGILLLSFIQTEI